MKTKIFFLSLVAIAACGQLFAQDIDLDSLYDARIFSTQVLPEVVEIVVEEPVAEEPIVEEPVVEIAVVEEPVKVEIPKPVEGVYIDSVFWALRNVDGYYTFNEAQTACPEGWRLPTPEEFEQMCAADPRWTNPNGETLKKKRFRKRPGNGMSFGTSDNYVFLPAAGYADSRDKQIDKYPSGFYWTSEMTDKPVTDKEGGAHGKYLRFHDKKVYVSNNPSFDGKFTVRCVKQEDIEQEESKEVVEEPKPIEVPSDQQPLGEDQVEKQNGDAARDDSTGTAAGDFE